VRYLPVLFPSLMEDVVRQIALRGIFVRSSVVRKDPINMSPAIVGEVIPLITAQECGIRLARGAKPFPHRALMKIASQR